MDPVPVIVHCREKDIRRVAITCICGTRSVAEIPKQTAKAKNMHTCTNEKCQRIHIFQWRDGKWHHEVIPFDLNQTLVSKETN